jgi:signal transduction histidine kinase
MRSSSIPCIAIASVIVFLGCFAAFVYARRRTKAPDLLSFSVTCFLFSVYAITSAGLYSADSYLDGRVWQRYGIAGLVLSSIALLKFIGDYTGGRVSRAWFWALAAPLTAGAALDVFWHDDLMWREAIPAVKRIGCPLGMEFVYNEVEVGPLVSAQFAICFILIAYAIYVSHEFYRSGDRRRAAPLLIALAILWTSGLNDLLIGLGAYTFYYTTEYAYMAIVFLMSYSIAEESVSAAEIIRERADMEDRLRHAEKMEAIGRLAGGIAHDLNNMLTPIIGYVDIARRRRRSADEMMEYFSRIGDAAEHSRRLTWQLLAFSRKQLLDMRVVDLNEVVAGAEQMLRSLIPEDVEIGLALADDAGHVRADATQLQQILVNLAINARDAMPKGGSLRIGTSAERIVRASGGKVAKGAKAPGRYSVLSVKDSGHGMDGETAARVFEPFFTTKDQGRGIGLGLATVYGIVRQHEGVIELDTAPGAGSEFRVSLPTVDAPVTAATTTTMPAAPATSVGGMHVLVVEDEEAVRTWVCDELRGQGWDVVEASSPAEALAIAEKGALPEIDLLLTDVVMPGMNGFALHERLVEHYGPLRVLYISGYSGDVADARGATDGPLVLLHKPFSAAKLQSVLETLFAGPPAAG